MWKKPLKPLKNSFSTIIFFIILTGLIYPFLITLITHLICPWKANGSIVTFHDKKSGSLLMGQSFSSPNYFWSRPSATKPFPYNASYSSGSNLSPGNPQLLIVIKDRIANLKKFPTNSDSIPVDLVTASASGLDPDISIASANYQVPRIAKVRHLAPQNLYTLIQYLASNPKLGFLGEPTVNVLKLNFALDSLAMQSQ